MSVSITVSTELTSISCPACGGQYAISIAYRDEAWRRGGFKQTWACPYCKVERGFGESEADRLKIQISALESAKNEAETRRVLAQQESEHFRKSRDILKGMLTKERKRVGNGVCPCCNRSFSNLQRHMVSKHPDHKLAIRNGEV